MLSKNANGSARDAAPPATKPTASTTAEQSGPTVTVKGRLMKVVGVLLATLLGDPEMVAAPAMVIPLVAAVGRVTMLAAREKLGKSTLAAYLAAVVSCGRELWGQTVERGKVLWVGLEEEPGDAVRRFVAMGADPDNVVIVPRLTPDRPVEQLEVEIVAHQPRLVIIDSLAAFYREVEDENAATAWTKALLPLIELARRSRAAILVLHHANRSQGSYRGSSAIGAAMDMIIEMSESGDDASVRVMKPRGRWSVAPYAIRYEPTAEWSLVEGGGDCGAASRAAKVAELQQRIFSWLAARAEPALTVEIRKAIGGKGTDCDEALRDLVARGMVAHLGKRQGYVIARAAPQEPREGVASADQTALPL